VKRTLVLIALAACSDPATNDGATACRLGMLRDPGPSCSVPNVPMKIDGDSSDWAQPKLDDAWHSLWHSCAPDGCKLMWAQDGDSFVFSGSREQAPSDNVIYGIQFAQYIDFSLSVVWVTFRPSEVGVGINKFPYSNVPIEYAYTPGGWEIRIPRAIIPFAGFAYVERYEREYKNGNWVTTDAETVFDICWDSDDPGDPCNGNDWDDPDH
jgi:hypothetical protein